MTNRKTLTLEAALELARSGKSGKLATAAGCLNGVAAFGLFSENDGGELGGIYRNLLEVLPMDRDFTIDQWIEATHERVEQNDACDVWRSTFKLDPPKPPKIRVGSRVRPAKAEMSKLGVGLVVKIVNGDHHIRWLTKSKVATGWRTFDLVVAKS